MMHNELLILGTAFLIAGLVARAGNRIGLPTIPLFIAAGICVGPNTPGPVLFEHPDDLALLAAFGLIFLLFYLGVEFSIDDLTSGGTRLWPRPGLPRAQRRRRAWPSASRSVGATRRRSSSPASSASRRRPS